MTRPAVTLEKILLLRFSSAGDVVLVSPALDALKRARPELKVVWAVKEQFAPLIRNNSQVDEVVALEKGEGTFAFAKRLAATGFDAILDLQGSSRSRILRARFLGHRSVVWNKRPWQDSVPVRMGWRPYRARKLIADRYHEAVESLLETSLERGVLRYYASEQDLQEGMEAVSALGLERPRRVGMSPGAMWRTKCWPAERFAALATRTLDAGCDVVLTGSPNEAPIVEAIRALEPRARSLVGALSLASLAGAIAQCDAFVANDSGPMHIARGLGVPTVAFFGSTDPRQFEFAGHSLQRVPLECSPCHFYGRAECPRGHFRCMRDISVEAAWTGLATLLAGPRRVPPVHG